MDELEDLLHGRNNFIVFTTMEAGGESWDLVKLAKAPLPRVIDYWPFQGVL